MGWSGAQRWRAEIWIAKVNTAIPNALNEVTGMLSLNQLHLSVHVRPSNVLQGKVSFPRVDLTVF